MELDLNPINKEESNIFACICGTSVFNEYSPITREDFIYKAIADGKAITDITPINRKEKYLYNIANKITDIDIPITREEIYLYNWCMGTHDTPIPLNRKEEYYNYLCNRYVQDTFNVDFYKLSKDSITLGEDVELTVCASAQGSNLTYRFKVGVDTLQESSKNSVTWKPTTKGIFNLYITVYDDKGNSKVIKISNFQVL